MFKTDLFINVTPIYTRTQDGKFIIPKNQLRKIETANSLEYQMRRRVLEGFAERI